MAQGSNSRHHIECNHSKGHKKRWHAECVYLASPVTVMYRSLVLQGTWRQQKRYRCDANSRVRVTINSRSLHCYHHPSTWYGRVLSVPLCGSCRSYVCCDDAVRVIDAVTPTCCVHKLLPYGLSLLLPQQLKQLLFVLLPQAMLSGCFL